MQNLIVCLEQDHDMIRTLMNYIRSEDLKLPQKKNHFEKFCSVVLSNIRSEEHAVYAPSRILRNNYMQQQIQTGLKQHFLIKNSIVKLRLMENNAEWMQEFETLSTLLEYHLGEEESEFFAELSRGLSDEQLSLASEHYLSMRSDCT